MGTHARDATLGKVCVHCRVHDNEMRCGQVCVHNSSLQQQGFTGHGSDIPTTLSTISGSSTLKANLYLETPETMFGNISGINTL